MSIFRNTKEKLMIARKRGLDREGVLDAAKKRFSTDKIKIELLKTEDKSVLKISEGKMSKEEIKDILSTKIPEDIQFSGKLDILQKGVSILNEMVNLMDGQPELIELADIISQLDSGTGEKKELLTKKWQMLVPELDQNMIDRAVAEVSEIIPDNEQSSEALNAMLDSYKDLASATSDPETLSVVMEGLYNTFSRIDVSKEAKPPAEEKTDERTEAAIPKGRTIINNVPDGFSKKILEKKPDVSNRGIAGAYALVLRWTRKAGVPDDFTYECADKGMTVPKEIIAAFGNKGKETEKKIDEKLKRLASKNVPLRFTEEILKKDPEASKRSIASHFSALFRWARMEGVPDHFINKCAEEGITSAKEIIKAYSENQKKDAEKVKKGIVSQEAYLKNRLTEIGIPEFEVDSILKDMKDRISTRTRFNLAKMIKKIGPEMTAIAIINGHQYLARPSSNNLFEKYKRPKAPKGVNPLLKKLEDLGMGIDTRRYIASYYEGAGKRKMKTLLARVDEAYKKLGSEKFYVLAVRIRTLLSCGSKRLDEYSKKHFGELDSKKATAYRVAKLSAEVEKHDPESAEELKENLKKQKIPIDELSRRITYLTVLNTKVAPGSFRSEEKFYKEVAKNILEGKVTTKLLQKILASTERSKTTVERLAGIWKEFGAEEGQKLISAREQLVDPNVVDAIFEQMIEREKEDLLHGMIFNSVLSLTPGKGYEICERPESTKTILDRIERVNSKLKGRASEYLEKTETRVIFGTESKFDESLKSFAQQTVKNMVKSSPKTGVSTRVLSERAYEAMETMTVVEDKFGSETLATILAEDGLVLTLEPDEAVRLVDEREKRKNQTFDKLLKAFKKTADSMEISAYVQIPTTEEELRTVNSRIEEIMHILGKENAGNLIRSKPKLLEMDYEKYATETLKEHERLRELKEFSDLLSIIGIPEEIRKQIMDVSKIRKAHKNIDLALDLCGDEKIVGDLLCSKDNRKLLLRGSDEKILNLVEKEIEKQQEEAEPVKEESTAVSNGAESKEMELISSVVVPKSVERYLKKKGFEDVYQTIFAVTKAVKTFTTGSKLMYVEKELNRWSEDGNKLLSALRSCGVLNVTSSTGKKGVVRVTVAKNSDPVGNEFYSYLGSVYRELGRLR